MSSIKYKVNHTPITYNHLTRTYEVGENSYPDYQAAKANQWRCDKCAIAFPSFKNLRHHKNEDHAY